MRVELLIVGPAHDQAEIRFHPRLTVIGGMETPARSGFADVIVGAVSGKGVELAGARWVDNTGSALVGAREAGEWRWTIDDGELGHDPGTVLGLDDRSLRRLMVLSASDLAVPTSETITIEGPELAEARATLASIDAELADALGMGAKVEALRAEVADIDEFLRTAQADGYRRRHTALAAQLEQVRIEAASLRGGVMGADEDQRCIAAAPEVRALAERWRDAHVVLRTERQRWGNRERLDRRTVSEALETPEQVPPELDALATIFEAAEAQRGLLSDRLTALATEALPQPSHPAIVRLAHANQEDVWSAARRALDAEHRLEHQSLALGGLQAEGVSPVAASDLETAHDAVDVAEREVHRRRVPGLVGAVIGLVVILVSLITFPVVMIAGIVAVIGTATWSVALPSRELSRRRQVETDALQRAGVASYITFQMRRLEVNIDPKATEPLELAALEYRRAIAAWRKLAGDLPASDAMAIEPETRQYAAALAGSRGAVNAIADVRRQLANEAEPAVAKARERLLAACRPFGIEDPRLAVELVRHQATVGGQARLQAALEGAERQEASARADLEHRLSGFGSGTPASTPGAVSGDEAEIERRLDAFEQARASAKAREQARAAARPAHEVEADLTRLESLVAAGNAGLLDAMDDIQDTIDIDLDTARERRIQAVDEYEAACRHLPDIARLADRREALERRVAVLTGGGDLADSSIDVAELQQRLLGRLAAARRVGPFGESVTVVLDEPFERIHGERKWAILDTLERLSASVQLVYLTDDVDVLVWARNRTPTGVVSLLEPVRDPV